MLSIVASYTCIDSKALPSALYDFSVRGVFGKPAADNVFSASAWWYVRSSWISTSLTGSVPWISSAHPCCHKQCILPSGAHKLEVVLTTLILEYSGTRHMGLKIASGFVGSVDIVTRQAFKLQVRARRLPGPNFSSSESCHCYDASDEQ